MKRRKFIQKSAIGLLSVGIPTTLYAWQIEPFWLEFVHQSLPVANLPNHLVGKRLMQISDIHVGTRFDWHYLVESFEKAKKYQPDFVVYTGDFICYDEENKMQLLDKIMPYFVKGKLGTVSILGNHDYGENWSDSNIAEHVVQRLNANHIQCLRNEHVVLDGLQFIGIDDAWGTNFHPHKALKSSNNNLAQIVLCHNPDVCDMPIWNGYQGWILAGHTHGGQCKPPFLPPPFIPVQNKKYTQGKIDLEDGRQLYINRALGCVHQLRFNVRPEITIFELLPKKMGKS